jgi:hypothetical protein
MVGEGEGPPGVADPPRRYREIMGEVTEAVARLRADDERRAIGVSRRLAQLRREMAAASDREALTLAGVTLHWEAALESLWHEQWMALSPLPDPDPDASPRDLEYLEAVVAQRAEALREAVRRRPLLGRR